MRPNRISAYLFIPMLLLLSACRVSYICFRPEQNAKHDDTAMVTRIYMDRFGGIYPDTAVAIKPNRFRVYGKWTNDNLASLYHYFVPHSKRMKRLAAFYGVSPGNNADSAYRLVQDSVRARCVRQIHQSIIKQQAAGVVYLVHGFNDPMAEAEFTELRALILSKNYAKKLVFVDVHWDGLDAHTFDGAKVAKVWQPALMNSRYASIGLRKLMTELEQTDQTPSIMITHSLGAGVAFGALFNTTRKWEEIDLLNPEMDKKRLQVLIAARTPETPVKIGVLAPAIPGEWTFDDFNKREPAPINSSANQIEKVVIGYNYNDYAVTKESRMLADINLSPFYGSTVLGCNYTVLGTSEIDKVYAAMSAQGYGDHTGIIVPIKFETPFRPKPNEKTREHAWHFYIENPVINNMLDDLFKD